MGDLAAWAGVITATASLIVAIVAMVKSLHAQREANTAQRRVVEIEERRERERRLDSLQANLHAEFRDLGDGSQRLYLFNRGAAEARDVRVRLNGTLLEEHCAGVRGVSMPSFIGAGAEVSYLLGISHQCAPPFQCEVLWDDDSGSDRSYRTTLTW